jgi:hypothetical protein
MPNAEEGCCRVRALTKLFPTFPWIAYNLIAYVRDISAVQGKVYNEIAYLRWGERLEMATEGSLPFN